MHMIPGGSASPCPAGAASRERPALSGVVLPGSCPVKRPCCQILSHREPDRLGHGACPSSPCSATLDLPIPALNLGKKDPGAPGGFGSEQAMVDSFGASHPCRPLPAPLRPKAMCHSVDGLYNVFGAGSPGSSLAPI